MRNVILSLIVCTTTTVPPLSAQVQKLKELDLVPVGVLLAEAKVMEKEALRVTKDPAIKGVDEPTFGKLKGAAFKDGTIEVKVMSKLLKDAPAHARGFIGVAFRIKDDNSKFECIYVRPQNARVDDQVRRNHSIQYFSYPDFKFDRLRKESPEKYESYADMGLDEWIDLKIEVKGAKAKLFVNGHNQPALIVNDLKHGADSSGAIGFWVDVGTCGYFTDFRVRTD